MNLRSRFFLRSSLDIVRNRGNNRLKCLVDSTLNGGNIHGKEESHEEKGSEEKDHEEEKEVISSIFVSIKYEGPERKLGAFVFLEAELRSERQERTASGKVGRLGINIVRGRTRQGYGPFFQIAIPEIEVQAERRVQEVGKRKINFRSGNQQTRGGVIHECSDIP